MEAYDERKVYASVYAAALNCEYSEQKAEKLATAVSKKITAFMKKSKSCLDSRVIREQVARHLKDKDIALMYKHHLDLS